MTEKSDVFILYIFSNRACKIARKLFVSFKLFLKPKKLCKIIYASVTTNKFCQ